ncbi:MAG: universal stress protein [Bacteriovoracaceae bacterium]
MNQINKIFIAVDLNEEKIHPFYPLRQMGILENNEIHLVYIFRTISLNFDVNEYPVAYPLIEDKQEIEKKALVYLRKIADELSPNNSKMFLHCLFSERPKKAFCEFVEKEKPHLIILAAREKKGTFEGSFSQYVTKHTHSHVLILKPKNS